MHAGEFTLLVFERVLNACKVISDGWYGILFEGGGVASAHHVKEACARVLNCGTSRSVHVVGGEAGLGDERQAAG